MRRGALSIKRIACRNTGAIVGSLAAKRSTLHATSGFSLIEMMVAVALFSVVMLVSTGALLSLITATRKAQALQSVMSNLNTALDGMVRSIRMGTNYHCGNLGAFNEVRDCDAGDVLLAFEPFEGSRSTLADQWVYWYNSETKRLYKSENGSLGGGFPLTAAEVQIDDFRFYVVGSTAGDTEQPKVVMVVKGSAGAANTRTRTTFYIQATATQRLLDI